MVPGSKSRTIRTVSPRGLGPIRCVECAGLVGLVLAGAILAPLRHAAADDAPPKPPPVAPAPPAPPNAGGSPPQRPPGDVEVLPDVVVSDSPRQPVVSASPLGPTPILDTAQPVGTLSGQDLHYRASGTLGDTVSHEPGVSNSSFAPGAGRPIIRGQGGDRIRVLEGGIGSLDVSGLSDDHAVPIDPMSVDHIEILRGPAALRYGSGAIGGLVYTHDGRIPETSIGRAFGGRAGGAWSSVDDGRSAYLQMEGETGCWNWRGSGFIRRSDDIDIPGFAKSRRQLESEGNPSGIGEAHGTLPNSYARAEGGSLGASWIGSRGFLGASVSEFSTNYGTPNEETVHIELHRFRADTRGRWDSPAPWLKEASWAASFADYKHTEFESPGVPGTVFAQQAGEGRVEFVHCPWGCWEGAFGFQASYTDLTITGEEALLPSAKTFVGSAFLTESREIAPDWTLDLGGRYDFTSIQSTDDRSTSSFCVAAGMVWKPSTCSSWALSVDYTERAPTAFELFADGPHVATGQFEVGDPTLGLERALGADLSWRHDGPWLSASITGFCSRYLNYIHLNPTGATDVPSGLPIYDFGEGKATLYGFEGETNLHVWKGCDRGVDLIFMGDYTHAQDDSLGQPLGHMPPLRLGTGVAYHDERWTARVDLLHAFDQTRTGPFEFDTDGYSLLDAGVSYSFCLGGHLATASVKGTNLLDEEVRMSTSFTKDLVPGPGRSVRFSLDVEF